MLDSCQRLNGQCRPVNSINTGTITPGKTLCLGEANMAVTTTKVVNICRSTIFPSYLLFFKKTVSRKTRLQVHKP